MRVVVVGTGSIGKRHGRLLCERPELTVELCEPSAAALAACLAEEAEWAGDLETHSSYEAALASRPAAVVLCTPHTLHAQQSIAALDVDVHVLCEKPMAATVAEAQAMVDAETRARDRTQAGVATVLAVGFTLHYHPALRVVKQLIEDGELGEVCHVHWHIGSLRTLMNSKSDYQAELAGALMLDYAHQPDQLLWMVGGQRPSSVYAAGGQVGTLPKTSNPNVCALTYSFPSGLVATINLNYVQHPDKGELSVVGDKGWATLDMIPPGIQHVKIGRVSSFGTEDEMAEETIEVPYERDDMFREQHAMFLECIAGDRAPETTAAAGLLVQQMIELSTESWQQGKPLEFPTAAAAAPPGKL